MKMSIRHARLAGGACCSCALALSMWPAIAVADWEVIPDVRMEVEANDNPRLGQRPEHRPEADFDRTAARMLMDARMNLRNSGPRGSVTLQPRVRVDAYSDSRDDDLERQDIYLNSRANYNWQRARAGLNLNLNRESIISSELSDLQPIEPGEPIDDPIDNETGLLVLLDEFRNRINLRPYAEFDISERSAILMEARLLDISYTGPEILGRTDFTDISLSLGIGRTIDSRTSATARMIVSNFEADLSGNETDTVGVEGTFARELNELWTFSLTTGLQRSDFKFVDPTTSEVVDNASTNYTMSIGFSKRTELSALDIDLFRVLNPNAIGFLIERNEVRVRYARQLSQRLSAGVGFRAMETGTLEGVSADRQLLRADIDVEWAFTPSWSFAARFGAIDQEFSGARLDGQANMLSIGAVYRGLSRRPVN